MLEVLDREGEPLGPRAIYERLTAVGRADRERSLGGILQSPKRGGRVEQLGRGRWTVLP